MADIRFGVIGTGMMGIEHIENVQALPGSTVTAISDPCGQSVAAAEAACVDQVLTFTDYRELLRSDCCDAIIIATPNLTRREIAADAVQSGLHCLIEKPLCTTTAAALELHELAERSQQHHPDQVVWVGLEYRYMPPIAEVIRRVRSGVIGRPHMVAIREHRFPFLDKVGNWNRFRASTGGTLVEKCCHFFDLMCVLMQERPQRVMASGSQSVNHLDERYDGQSVDMLDNAFVVVEFSEGRRAMLDLCMFAEATHSQEELAVTGALGKLEALVPQNIVRQGLRGSHSIGNVGTDVIYDPTILHEGLHHGSSFVEHQQFAHAIRSGSPAEVSTADGLWSVAIGEAAHRSIDDGRIVEIAEVLPTSSTDSRRDIF